MFSINDKILQQMNSLVQKVQTSFAKFLLVQNRSLMISVLLIICSLVVLKFTSFNFVEKKFFCGKNISSIHHLPSVGNVRNQEETSFIGWFNNKFFLPKTIKVFSSGCINQIKLNGFSLLGKENKDCTSYVYGHEIVLSDYLRPKLNTLEITLDEQAEETAFQNWSNYLMTSYVSTNVGEDNILFSSSLITLLLSFCIFFFVVSTRLRFSKGISLIIVAGFILRLFYLFHTNFENRSHDISSHLIFINYVLSHGLKIPPETLSISALHPPLYYFAVASFYKFSNFIGVYEYAAMQFFSVLSSMGFVIVASLILCKTNLSRFLCLMGSALLALWPGNIINSAMISNDSFAAFLYAIALYFLLSWLKDNKFYKLILSSLFACLTTLTKLIGTSFSLVLTFFVVAEIYKIFKAQISVVDKLKKILSALACALLPLGLSLKLAAKYNHGFAEHYREGLLNLSIVVDKNPMNLFYFDVKTFLFQPFVNPYSGGSAREYVWNFFWKSSLFGEYYFDGQHVELMAQIISLALFLMLVYSLIGFFGTDKKQASKVFLLFAVNFVVLAASLIYGRAVLPVSSIVDFRYVMPILISWVYLYAQTIQQCENKGQVVLAFSGKLLAIAFVVLSCLFFMFAR